MSVSLCQLLFVEITQWGINTGINHENYQEIIQDFCKDNSQEFIDLLATNSSFFIHKDPVYFAAEDILNMNGGKNFNLIFQGKPCRLFFFKDDHLRSISLGEGAF